jgi:hypothetical protein
MASTITALGTVPQTILNLLGAAEVPAAAAFTTLVEFDTHGSERIAFQAVCARGNFSNLDISFQVRDSADGTYHDAPTSLARVHLDPATAADLSEAFQIELGRNIDKIRIQYKTAGSPDAASAIRIDGQLTAPTYPIIGGSL